MAIDLELPGGCIAAAAAAVLCVTQMVSCVNQDTLLEEETKQKAIEAGYTATQMRCAFRPSENSLKDTLICNNLELPKGTE